MARNRKNLLSLETLSALCVLRNRRKAHSNTSSTATRRGTIDSRDAMALETLCVLRNRRKAHSNTSSTATLRGTIDSRDASLLSTVELPFFTRRTARA